ncbi:hypothetical protein EYF80_051265 [Liparis tanakae]|uniref:Uncharacterized protein n=1 Tax=Liparis tanakae TaxID=230148 RepID=A0A4Z2FDU9_9TELE|nr:hypothetical protein EYF80_051265 [Liparis tanakae]
MLHSCKPTRLPSHVPVYQTSLSPELQHTDRKRARNNTELTEEPSVTRLPRLHVSLVWKIFLEHSSKALWISLAQEI